MPVRTGNTYSTSQGTYNYKDKTFQGKGPAPVGSKKTPERSYLEVPTVTTEAGKVVSTSGFSSRAAAKKARKRAKAAHRRVRAIELTQGIAKRQGAAAKRTEAHVKKAEAKIKSSERQQTLRSAPKLFKGQPTAGTPTLQTLKASQRKGTLKTNQRGYLTTPPVRKVSKELEQAKAKAPRLTGLSKPEAKFAEQVAEETPLKARTVAAWTKLEGGNSTGDFNRLNIGHTDSGPLPLTADPRWRKPKQAGHLTAEFLKGRYGGPSTGIQAILPASKGKPPAKQLDAIASSGWATDPNYSEKLHSVLTSVQATGKPISKKLRKRAASLGLKTKAQAPAGKPPKKVVTRFKAVKHYANELTKRNIPYVWGGGHGAFEVNPQGLDCSGAVSWVLHKAGLLKTPLTSGDMGQVLKPGPGAVTVFYNPTHTFMRIGNEYWGTSAGDSGAGGLGPHPAPSKEYLSQYSVGHIPGLGKKQALQLGITDLSGGESFPGMTLSSSGTSATINEGAGATKVKPGSSKQPIKLSPTQKAHRTMRTLQTLGVGTETTTSENEVSPTLQSLEEKYSVKAE